MSEPETPAADPTHDDAVRRHDRLVRTIVRCTFAIIATVIITGVVVAQQVSGTVTEQAALTRDEAWSAADGGTDSAIAAIAAQLAEEREVALEREKAAARRSAAPSTALAPARVTPRRAGLGAAVNLGDVRVAAGWQVRTVEPATSLTDASMQLENVRVSLTKPGSALSSIHVELRGADGKAVGTGWCYAPTDEGTDTRPTVWCQPFDVSGEPVTAKVGAEIRS